MKKEIISWIKNWFKNNSGNAKGVIIGISGGKDSTIVAKLCCEAIGKENVFGVLMPNGEQKDIDDAIEVCNLLGIRYKKLNIEGIFCSTIEDIENSLSMEISKESVINIAPRIRMTCLYAIGQTMGYRVVGTSNFTERTLGYFTKYGDGACDFNPLGNLYYSEVIKLGLSLGLPEHLVLKAPADGLTNKTDEEVFGYSYKEIDDALKKIKELKQGEIDPTLLTFISDKIFKSKHKMSLPLLYE